MYLSRYSKYSKEIIVRDMDGLGVILQRHQKVMLIIQLIWHSEMCRMWHTSPQSTAADHPNM